MTVEWRKSSHSLNEVSCVEVAEVWRRAAGCEAGHCVEIADAPDVVLVRDSKLGDNSPVLTFDREAWAGFVAGVKGGEFG
jgi:hypothetical protein